LRGELPEMAVVNMNYRLADENNAPFPMQTDDITKVVNDLKAKQSEYQIGEDIGFFGISAGGHLSLLWSYTFDTANQVKMVCSFTGPTDLSAPAYLNSENEVLRDLVLQFGADIEVLKNVSPLFKVQATSPPTQLFYGGADPLIPTSQGVELAARLTELNVVHEFTLYPNEGHGWVGANLFDTSTKLKAFVETHLFN
ncbi:MAG: alpha/beta hydrolase, partial [Maribacter sp.]